MDLKISQQRSPELKIKKEAEIAVHQKQVVNPKQNKDTYFDRPGADILGNQSKPANKSREREVDKSDRKSRSMKAVVNQPPSNSVESRPSSSSVQGQPSDVASAPTPASNQSNQEAKDHFVKSHQRGKTTDSKIKVKGQQSNMILNGVKAGGTAMLGEVEGGEDVAAALHIVDTAKRPFDMTTERLKHAGEAKRLKVKHTDRKIQAKQNKQEWQTRKKQFQKQQYQKTVKQRKLQYVINKLTGNGQRDSLGKVTKDVAKMKLSMALAQIGKYIIGLLAPFGGMFLMAAAPVALIVVLLYASPLAAYMPNPSDNTPSVQEVLSGYYQEFNAALADSVDDNSAITYLHMEDGNYVSNYTDTLMVYMVQYGTGDLGVVMDEEHQQYLKEIFDEMNSSENTVVTTEIKAGQSLGNVVTSAYCSCRICCGIWAGGPTASGVMPTANHTIAVDAKNPFLPMGTRVIMNGTEYVVEDTGNFDRYGVQFDIYFDNHAAATAWGHKTLEAYLAEGDENTVTVTRQGSYVKNLNFEDYIALNKLTAEQEELLREVMSEEFRAELPSFGVGSDVAALAVTKVGYPYSQDHTLRMTTHYDCSSLVYRCYKEFGVILPGIAANQGKHVVEQGLEVTADMLQPGDLIFYSYEVNGRFRNISHVAIYIGNGRMVHASSPTRGVVNDPFTPSNINLYGRIGGN